MTSPLPPRLRDTTSLFDRVRQDRANLKQLYPGFVGGRFAPARRLGATQQLGDIEDDSETDAETATIAFSNTDTATASTAGRVTLHLTHEPVDGSLQVYWNGLALAPTEYVLNGQTVTFTDHLVFTGDRITAAYAYYPSDVEPDPGYVEAVLERGPIWFGIQDDSSGFVLTDYSGNGRNGDYVGPSLGASQVVPNLIPTGRTSADFDGVGDYSNTGFGSWLNTTQVAWVAWINADTVTGGTRSIAGRNNTDTYASNAFELTATGRLRFTVLTNTGTYIATGSTALSPGTTYMVSAIYDGTGIRVFINSALEATAAASGNLLTSGTFGAQIGAAGIPALTMIQFFDGRIGPVAMFDPATTGFSATDVADLYAAGVAT